MMKTTDQSYDVMQIIITVVQEAGQSLYSVCTVTITFSSICLICMQLILCIIYMQWSLL